MTDMSTHQQNGCRNLHNTHFSTCTVLQLLLHDQLMLWDKGWEFPTEPQTSELTMNNSEQTWLASIPKHELDTPTCHSPLSHRTLKNQVTMDSQLKGLNHFERPMELGQTVHSTPNVNIPLGEAVMTTTSSHQVQSQLMAG